jgi:hypothetical protein
MSDCYICDDENVTTKAQGLCADCNQFACGDPSNRTDHKFHGMRCHCTCRKFICKLDMTTHALHEGGTTARCFPDYTLDSGAALLSAAQEVLAPEASVSFERVADAASDFLVAVDPGPAALRKAMLEFGASILEEFAVGDRFSFRVQTSFVTPQLVRRLAALAARSIAQVDRLHNLSLVALELPERQRRSLGNIQSGHPDRRPVKREHRMAPMVRLPSSSLVQSLRNQLPDPAFIRSIEPAPPMNNADDIAKWVLQLDDLAPLAR